MKGLYFYLIFMGAVAGIVSCGQDNPVSQEEQELCEPASYFTHLPVAEEIRLYVDQAPAGTTTHRVLGKRNEGDSFAEIHLFSGSTDFGDMLEHEFEAPADNIR